LYLHSFSTHKTKVLTGPSIKLIKPSNQKFGLLILSFLLLAFQSCHYSKPTAQKLFAKAQNQSFDMVVVPGIPFEDSIWSRTMKGRVYWAKYLYDQGIAKNIMFSGAAVHSPYVEADIMASYAKALGIPANHIFTETAAEHSTENIFYSYKKSQKLGFKSVALASDPFQSKQLRRFIRKKVSPDVVLIPFVIDTLKVLEPGFIHPIIDFESARKADFVPLKKRESFWKRLRGTLGKNIRHDLYN
jgi:hypothetical protein